jgi:DNA-binding NtrC family response regulator
MAADKLNVLIVEDDPQLLRILQAVLKDDAVLRVAGTGRQALQALADEPPAIVLLDMRLPDMTGMEILEDIGRRGLAATVIVMTAHGSVDLAVAAMRQGAYDFLTKPLDFERVRVMVRNAVERHRIIQELDDYKSAHERTRFRGLMGSSPAMQRLYRQLASVGQGASPVLVAGEPGTELEACARALHEESARASARLVAREGRALGEAQLAEALSEAAGGTLHIAGVESMPESGRAALMAFLQDAPGGGARVVASTSAPLDELAQQGRFERPLLVVLESARVQLPPLRERGEDVLDLAEHLLSVQAREVGRSFAEIAPEAQVALVTHTWPGNVEELESCIRRAVQQHEGRVLEAGMLPPELAALATRSSRRDAAPLRGLAASAIRPLWEVEREAIENALKICEGSVLDAARLLEVSPGTIYRKQQTWKARKS